MLRHSSHRSSRGPWWDCSPKLHSKKLGDKLNIYSSTNTEVIPAEMKACAALSRAASGTSSYCSLLVDWTERLIAEGH